MYHSTPPPPPPAAQFSGNVPTTQQPKKTRRWPWFLGLVAALATGGAIGVSMTPEPEVVTQEVEPADIDQRREALDEHSAQLQEREDELTAYEAELDQRSSDLDEQLAAFEAPEAEAETAAEAAETEEPTDDQTTIPGSGTFLVGDDVAPGTYATEGSDVCYWARLSGLSGEFSDIITNGVPAGPAYVTIAESDVAFETASCGTWTLQ